MSKDVWAWNVAEVLELGAPYLDHEKMLMECSHKRFDLVPYGGNQWIILD